MINLNAAAAREATTRRQELTSEQENTGEVSEPQPKAPNDLQSRLDSSIGNVMQRRCMKHRLTSDAAWLQFNKSHLLKTLGP